VHAGSGRPLVHPSAEIAASAIIEGDVSIGAGSCIMHGAKILSQGGPVEIGAECIVMENAVVRGTAAHPCRVGDRVLIGPHAHVSGAQIGDAVFVATGAVVMNNAKLGSGTVVQIHAVVHINTDCPPNTVVPIGHVAIGTPAQVMTAEAFAAMSGDMGFTRTVFGFDSAGWSNAAATAEICRRYSRALTQRRASADAPNKKR
jgi:carbonic anhydrase/acetyltransferase-like protein (isoleucine patch superfamily)